MGLRKTFLTAALTGPLASCIPEFQAPECGDGVSVQYVLDKTTGLGYSPSVKGARDISEEICARSSFTQRDCQAVVDGTTERRDPLFGQDDCIPTGTYPPSPLAQ